LIKFSTPPHTDRQLLPPAALAELGAFLAIPSVSADHARVDAVREAVQWVVDFVDRAGGWSTVVDGRDTPLVEAIIPASGQRTAPTILCYGHVDVQPAGDLSCWQFEPFAATPRDGWVYGRGIADDKGQLWLLLRAAAELAAAGSLPVNVRFCCDGQEEVGGTAIVDHLREHAGAPAACVIFDTPMLDDETHVFTTATRGTLYMHLTCRTSRQDLHSGVYGGAAMNAVHVLTQTLSSLFDDDGTLAPELHAGAKPATDDERATWTSLPPGETLLTERAAVPATPDAGATFYNRTWELPALDVHGVHGGSPFQQKTIVVAEAHANLSMRLADGQRWTELAPIVEGLLRNSAPADATIDVEVLSACDPGRVHPDAPPLVLAADAFDAVLGRRPLLLRSGGSLPLMPLLEQLSIPAVVTGFAVPASNMHAPNERMRVRDLVDGLVAARAMFTAFGDLP
jgi:acetylornithine deacetylase/succinyl-diaminopimelate desuccinylase-like protein